jgi:hypothetical protein
MAVADLRTRYNDKPAPDRLLDDCQVNQAATADYFDAEKSADAKRSAVSE